MSSTEKLKSAAKAAEPPSTIELEAVAVNVDACARVPDRAVAGLETPSECDSDLGPPSELLLGGSDSADSLKNEKVAAKQQAPQGCWARYRQRVRESRKWKIITCCWVSLLVTAILLIILVPIIYCVIVPAVANSEVSSSVLTVSGMTMGKEDLAKGTIAARIRGSMTNMPAFEVYTGAAQSRLYTGDDVEFATMELPAMAVQDGKMDLDMESLMVLSNRTAFDTLAGRMVRGLPGIVRMRAEKVPVTVKLGPLKIAVYGGVTIDKITEFPGLEGLNNVNVSDSVVLVDATSEWLRIAMDVALPNPSTTVATAQDGIVLRLMAADTNETLGKVQITPFTLRTGMTKVKAYTDIMYTNTASSELSPATPRSLLGHGPVRDNTQAVRKFLSAYMSGQDVALRLQGPDLSDWGNATYVQRALTNWTTDIALAAQSSASFVTGTRIAKVDPFATAGQVELDVEISTTNPFDLPVTVRNVSIVIRMNDKDVGEIAYADNGIIPPKGNITLTGLKTTIDIGNFLGEIFNDFGDWLGSVFSGKGTIVMGTVDMLGHIKVALDGAFPVFLPIESRNLTLDQLTDPNALMPSGR